MEQEFFNLCSLELQFRVTLESRGEFLVLCAVTDGDLSRRLLVSSCTSEHLGHFIEFLPRMTTSVISRAVHPCISLHHYNELKDPDNVLRQLDIP